MSKKQSKPKVKKVKVPKFKLISYTMKAIIPTGMYANLQPEITVQSDTIENAERAVMPHIEALFAKYRDGGAPIMTPQPPKPVVAPVAPKPVAPKETPVEKTPKAPENKVEFVPAPPAIIMTVPFTRAKTAIQSCTSVEALKLVADQIEKSIKLINTEKAELSKMVTAKSLELNKK